MSRRGNCHDNAVAESFFQLLKRERIKKKIYGTREEARSVGMVRAIICHRQNIKTSIIKWLGCLHYPWQFNLLTTN